MNKVFSIHVQHTFTPLSSHSAKHVQRVSTIADLPAKVHLYLAAIQTSSRNYVIKKLDVGDTVTSMYVYERMFGK